MCKKFIKQAELMVDVRSKANLSQFALGRLLGVSSQEISNIERGISGIPTRHMEKLALLSCSCGHRATREMAAMDFVGAFIDDKLTEFCNNGFNVDHIAVKMEFKK